MKKSASLCLLCLWIAQIGFAESLFLQNETSYPVGHPKSRMAVQWANSARDVEEGNRSLMQGMSLHSDSLQVLKKPGKIELKIPEKAQYFRVLLWSDGKGEPDFHTNWVDITPNKSYTLKPDHLVPSLLMLGMGC
jgi:hypothetical protein